jgi:CheY-like chemotaxis protein
MHGMNTMATQRASPRKRTAKNRYSVLLVDDSEHDRLFLRRALQATPQFVIVGELDDGEAAIEYLDGQEQFSDRTKYPFPDVMLLDLKMPRKTGHEVLEWLQTQLFDDLFVAVVSGSFLPDDIARSMALGADAYFRKGAMRQEVEAMIGKITLMLGQA